MKPNRKTAAFCALVMAIAAAAMAVQPVSAVAASRTELDAYAAEVVTLVNEERAIYGLPPVKEAKALDNAAQLRAAETVRSFSHTRPDGRASSTVLADLDIPWRSCGENIAYGYQDAEAVMDGWMHSEGHRANILSTSFEYIGVGVAEQNGVIYCTQVFTGGAALEAADAPAVTVPETEAPTEITVPAAPCIGDACPETVCTDGNCLTNPADCTNGNCLTNPADCTNGNCLTFPADCTNGNCLTLPAAGCPGSNVLYSLIPGLSSGNCGNTGCGITNVLCALTGKC